MLAVTNRKKVPQKFWGAWGTFLKVPHKNKKMKNISVLLVGAANCGKSTLFYTLTHKRADIGNRAGVTVKESAGKIRKRFFSGGLDVTLVDLPGIYSLTPHSEDERLTVRRLADTRFDIIINVLDSTSLAAHLPLTLSLINAFPKTPMIVAANMADELRAYGVSLDEELLSRELGVPVVSLSASKKEGLDALCREIENAARSKPSRTKASVPSPADLAEKVLKTASEDGKSVLFGLDDFTSRADRIITSKLFGIPIFLLVFSALFYISFGGIGAYMTELFSDAVISPLQSFVSELIRQYSNLSWLSSLINKGIFFCLTGNTVSS